MQNQASKSNEKNSKNKIQTLGRPTVKSDEINCEHSKTQATKFDEIKYSPWKIQTTNSDEIASKLLKFKQTFLMN